jgi:RNA polymerase sigma-70 factor (ECF subfamily)
MIKEADHFSQLYQQYKEQVWRWVSRYVPAADREDLFQEVFLRVHRALGGFRGEAAFSTWLYRLTANTALNYLKKQQRYQLLKEALAALKIEPFHQEEKKEEGLAEIPLTKLNPKQKMILVMFDVEERSLEEIAHLLKLPLGTVKSNLHRAREIIKKELRTNE